MKQKSGNRLRLPEFIGIGPARTGTTWLHEVLAPVAGLPYIKETHFFSMRYRRGVKWYASFFRDHDELKPLGEICPYFGFSDVPERVRLHIPECKVFITFRDPVERAYSHYKLARRCGLTSAGFEQALVERPEILESSRYSTHLRRWHHILGRNRILVMTYEDLVADRQGFVDNICDFIGTKRTSLAGRTFSERAESRIQRAPKSASLARASLGLVAGLHVIRAHRTISLLTRIGFWSYCIEGGEPFTPLDTEIDAKVRAQLRPEVDTLEEMIQRDLTDWKTGSQVRKAGAPS